MPLIVRGARQVGKTFIVEAFGQEEFKNTVTINFESTPLYQRCFETLEPRSIINQIELMVGRQIIAGETLLFFDEIQQCPRALQSLRYFKEQMPSLHIIAAGSLLEFAIRDENFSFPVGRVQFAKLFPLSFEEFLDACGENVLRNKLSLFSFSNPPPPSIHEYLLQKVKEYFIVGGMPAVVQTYVKSRSYLEARYIQKSLWDSYEADFGKYAKKTQHRHLKKIFIEGPKLIGDHFKYSRIDPELPNPAREMKQAIEELKLAGLLHPITATSAGSLPLSSGLKQNIFKLLFLDIGLVGQAMNVDIQDPGVMTGPLAEQFVGQEFLAYHDPYLDTPLFFWSRESSTAEVDYVLASKGLIFPIEVKAGKTGKLKSLHLFIKEKKSLFGIKISQEPLVIDKDVLSIPFYLVSHLTRLIVEKL